MALKTLWCCGDASFPEQRSALRAIHTLNHKKYICKLGGLSPIHSKCLCGAQGFRWGTRVPFPPVAAMVVVVVMPAVCCAKANEILINAIKTLKLVVCNQFSYELLYCKTYYYSHIANCSVNQAQVVWWPKPKPLWSNGPWHIGIAGKLLPLWEWLSHCTEEEPLEYWRKREKVIHAIPRIASCLRFFGYFSEWFLCPIFYGIQLQIPLYSRLEPSKMTEVLAWGSNGWLS